MPTKSTPAWARLPILGQLGLYDESLYKGRGGEERRGQEGEWEGRKEEGNAETEINAMDPQITVEQTGQKQQTQHGLSERCD